MAMYTAEASVHIVVAHCLAAFLWQSGVKLDWILLADRGIKGNGHFSFQEKNNLEIARKVVLPWLELQSGPNGLSHPDFSFSFLERQTSLRFLAIVDTAHVPLCLAAGPSFDVWTANERTEQWLHHCLFEDSREDDTEDGKPWWKAVGGQSKHGILLGVDGGDDVHETLKLGITEILLYAAIPCTSQEVHAPPTPPASSSPLNDSQEHETSLNIRIYALPLSSKAYKVLDHGTTVPHCEPDFQDSGFYYLPSPPQALSYQESDPPAKRPKIESMFEDATNSRRLHKMRGGQGMAKAMAAMDARMALPALSSPDVRKPADPLDSRKDESNKAPTARSRLSRASITGCIAIPPPTVPSITRPQSSHLTSPTKGLRSSRNRVESTLSPSPDGRSSEIPEDSNSGIEQQNKASLSRIIMAGMRMYGLQQQRRKSVSTFDTQSQLSGVNSVSTGEQDEYKAVYHQTFKAAAFVLRKHWTTVALGPEILRDTVDAFLARFCQDPLVAERFGDGLGFPQRTETSGGASDVLGKEEELALVAVSISSNSSSEKAVQPSIAPLTGPSPQ
ncbi:MAG: hypothetical protein Q9209_005860 [Squamulea sp. 1 TL-2023]